ncbi:hypothetical protein [Actinomadura parmotrematis]|uniref:FUSC family protein n=1 Tax=Actinomadura parmotrematis TaxID=2864039 RepID=A0ABS7FQU4_9ACTN|nr:hypothetical protein [Actinomadura parmotrematis]MBW8482094.1 hypothetical protein [Actinomadura parmotrematis]
MSGRGRRRPVRRADADVYLRLMLAGFAVSVLGTRAYLAATGYPQVGGGGLHISHALWGGLLLFAAALLPLVLAGRRASALAAVLTGVGAGLFIDEVGKLITSDYDYFFPAAAPIVYAVFLLAVLAYAQVRSHRRRTARAELHRAFGDLGAMLDGALDAHGRADLERRLANAAADEDAPGHLRRLAATLQDYVDTDVEAAEAPPGRLRRWSHAVAHWAGRFFTAARLRVLLTLGTGLLGALALADLLAVAWVLADSWDGTTGTLAHALQDLAGIDVDGRGAVIVVLVRGALDGVAGALLLVAAFLIGTGRTGFATALAGYALLFLISVVDLLVFYSAQFAAAAAAAAQFVLLAGVRRYRRIAE